MNDKKPDLCDSLSNNISLSSTDGYNSRNETDNTQNLKSESLYRRAVKRLPSITANIRDACFPITSKDNEKSFLQLQQALKTQSTSEVKEAMIILDNIDTKAQALLAYISISIAALVFLLPEKQNSSITTFILFDKITFTDAILLLLFILSIAMVLCLSCVNIIGAHTVLLLKSKDEKKRHEEYNDLVIKVTLGRRTRYLVAQRLSILTAACLGILFIARFIGNW